MSIVNKRALQDINLVAAVNLPDAGASAVTPTIDLNTLTPGRIPDVELQVSMPAVVGLVDAKTITLTVKDSDDGVTFAAVAEIPAIVKTGAGGVGCGAVDSRFKLPLSLRQYIQLEADVLAAGGALTDTQATMALVF